jgi:hypothetical protein
MFRQLWIDLRVRLSALFGRRTLNARALEEMEFHLEMREKQLRELGVPASEARSQARREFGNSLLFRRRRRHVEVFTPEESGFHDISDAPRRAGSSASPIHGSGHCDHRLGSGSTRAFSRF